MAKKLHDWIEADVRPYQDKSVAWLSQDHFFRDPIRPTYSDLNHFFAPADGSILYQREVRPEEYIVEMWRSRAARTHCGTPSGHRVASGACDGGKSFRPASNQSTRKPCSAALIAPVVGGNGDIVADVFAHHTALPGTHRFAVRLDLLDPKKACKNSAAMYCSTHSISPGNGQGKSFYGRGHGRFWGILRGISNHKVPALHFALLFRSWGLLPKPVCGEHLLAASSGLIYIHHTQSHRVAGRGSSFMCTGIAGFWRIRKGLQNVKTYRNASRSLEFAVVKVSGWDVKAGIDPIIKVMEKMELRGERETT